jgi:DNA-binding LytR/AlgR family response regulator
MKIFIIEDEQPAGERLKKMVLDLLPDAIIPEIPVSISSAVKWLKTNPAPDLILMDIHLSDGPSFEIFNEVQVASPIIFITAYDQYALDAFKLNSIDYLLKPVKKEELQRSIEKYQKLTNFNASQISELLKQMGSNKGSKELQKRIIIRYGDTIKMVEIADVAYFYTEDKINFLCTKDNLRYPIDQNLDELENIIDPAIFFRINRQFIVNISAIEKMLAWSKSRVKIILKPSIEIETIVSTERSPHFKEWLTGAY